MAEFPGLQFCPVLGLAASCSWSLGGTLETLCPPVAKACSLHVASSAVPWGPVALLCGFLKAPVLQMTPSPETQRGPRAKPRFGGSRQSGQQRMAAVTARSQETPRKRSWLGPDCLLCPCGHPTFSWERPDQMVARRMQAGQRAPGKGWEVSGFTLFEFSHLSWRQTLCKWQGLVTGLETQGAQPPAHGCHTVPI